MNKLKLFVLMVMSLLITACEISQKSAERFHNFTAIFQVVVMLTILLGSAVIMILFFKKKTER